MNNIKVGIVVQRYGKEVVGGSESLARDVAERLNANGCDVTVFTSCATDYITWKNEYAPGESILKGVIIKRFPSEQEREINAFNSYSETVFHANPKPDTEETEWVRQQGPYCPGLIEALQKEQNNFDVFLFFTYLYYTTIEGIKAIDNPEKPVFLFPTAHDEPPIYLNVMKNVFKRPDGLFFLTGSEMNLVNRLFPDSPASQSSELSQPSQLRELVRTGVDIKENIDERLFKDRYIQYVPYFLYAGRIEKGKGLETVFEAFESIRHKHLIDLVLMGKKLMDIPNIEGIKYVGYVSEEEKLSAFKGALASIQPSPLESLSITTLESFSQKTPVIVNKNCRALVEHVEMSDAGMAYGDVHDLIEHVLFISQSKNRKLRMNMGAKGYGYVKDYYSWEMVLQKMKKAFMDAVGNQGAFLQNRPLNP